MLFRSSCRSQARPRHRLRSCSAANPVHATAVTTDEQLTHASTLIPGSTIGKHLRHTHDHFRLLLDALRTSSPATPLLLSYDTRSRNVASETSHAAALESFRNLRRRLEHETSEGAVESTRRVLLEAVTPERVGLESSWAREVSLGCLKTRHARADADRAVDRAAVVRESSCQYATLCWSLGSRS